MNDSNKRPAGPEVLIMILLMLGLLILFIVSGIVMFTGDTAGGSYAIAAALSGGLLLLSMIILSK